MERDEIKKYFKEKVSAKDAKRPKLFEMLEFTREGRKQGNQPNHVNNLTVM